MTRHARINLCLAAPLLLLCFSGTSIGVEPLSPLTVEVTGVREARGQVIVRVFARADGFPRVPAKAFVTRAAPAQTGVLRIDFEPLEITTIAVAVAHDIDGDGDLNFNLFGAPTEPYGFSNGAKGVLGPPAYEAAVVDLSATKGLVRVEVSD